MTHYCTQKLIEEGSVRKQLEPSVILQGLVIDFHTTQRS